MAKRFRPNVCTVLYEPATGRVLVFRRVDSPPDAPRWQFPQGGIRPGETPREAMLRELEEEIGTARVEILAEAPRPIRYVFPPEMLRRIKRGTAEKRDYAGQEQTWFLARLLDGEGAIHFRNDPPEFDAYRWVTPREAADGIVGFKTDAYREALGIFGLLPE